MPTVVVVILNWNGKRYLEQFLPLLIDCTGTDAEVIVADNASTDDSVAFILQHYPQVRIIRNPSNEGFSRGYNLALKQVEADYYILLNSDIEVTPNWIAPVIELLESDPRIGACQPKIRSYHRRDEFEYAGAAGGYIDAYGYPFCRGRMFLTVEKDTGQYNNQVEISWATGACLFVRSELFHRLGGFDDDFFAHMEEIDFCWRLHNYGYRVMYCPGSTVYHIGGGTLPKASWLKTYLNFRNNFMLLYKNLPSKYLFQVFATRLILDGVAAYKFLFQTGFKDFWAVARAHISFYRALPSLRRKRKQLKHGSMKMMYKRNIVAEYYLRGKKRFSELDQTKFFPS
ncbi:MAG: glycosyltransferase family 2 protein [Bacteroidetes bacterium]|nr:MAG: glycosyltransferase family 2 protein [Bacteroidota bacterium]